MDTFERGSQAGKKWAAEKATKEEMLRLQSYRKGMAEWLWEASFSTIFGADEFTAFERVAFAICGFEHKGDRGYAARFWRHALDKEDCLDYARWEENHSLGNDGCDAEFLKGFCEGALSVATASEPRRPRAEVFGENESHEPLTTQDLVRREIADMKAEDGPR